MQQDKHLLMTVAEVAEALRLSRNTINNWLSQGYLHRVKIGGRTFVAREEVDEFLAKALKLDNGGQRKGDAEVEI